jgi:hypothetical protein
MNLCRLICILFFGFIFRFSIAQQLDIKHCEVVKYHTNIVLSDDKLTRTDSVIIRINDRNGEMYSKISIPFNKNRKLSDLSVWIETVDGRKIRELKKSEFTVKSAVDAMSLYEDDFVTTCYAKHNEYPYRIGYTYTHAAYQFLHIADWSPVLFPEITTRQARLTVNIPADAKTSAYVRNARQTSKQTAGHSVITTYDADFITPYIDEAFGVSLDDIAPRICIVPHDFLMGIKGSYEDWTTIGNWYYYLNKDLLALPPDEVLRVKSVYQGEQSPREIIRKLYHYLQDNTRYINVSIGIGGLKAYPAAYVAKNKYGDCKALSNYMKALLKVAGIESYSVLIQYDLQPSEIVFENAISQFNHVILVVPLQNDTIWIEATNQSLPFCYVHSGIQNRKALLIDENRSRLINTPAFSANDNSIKRKINIEINELGVASVNTDFVFRGYFFELFNELKNLHHTDDQDRFIRDYMPFTLYEMKDWQLEKADRDSSSISLKTKCQILKTLKKAGDEYYLESLPVRTGIFEKPVDRKLPLEWPFPYMDIDSTEITLPGGFFISSIPDDFVIENDFGSYSSTYRYEQSKLFVTKKLVIKAQKCTLEQYKGFYEFIENIRKNDKKTVALKKSS